MRADEIAKRVLEGEDPKTFLRRHADRAWLVVFLKDTVRPWDYAQYNVMAADESGAFLAGRKRLVAEIGPKRARQWKDHDASLIKPPGGVAEAEDPKRFLRRTAPRHRLDYKTWLDQVTACAWRRYRITPGDFEGPGGHENFWEQDMTPEEYVNMVGEKYDLDSL